MELFTDNGYILGLPTAEKDPNGIKPQIAISYDGEKDSRFLQTRTLSSLLNETDPNGISPNAPGAKLDSGKLKPWLCYSGFARALEEVARVTTKGAEKYTPNGWCTVENGEERYMEAAFRHLNAVAQGHLMDDGIGGTGCFHLGNTIWNLLAVLELQLRKRVQEKSV